MVRDSQKFYLTTPIYYVNASPHLGHAYTNTVADVIARYYRQKGVNTFFLTGTDEHGSKNMRAAEAAGKAPQEFVDRQAELFKKLNSRLGISNDDFIRTSDQKRHFPGAESFWKKLEEAGDIYKASYQGLYCVGHEAFVTKKDLVDGICEEHGKAPEIIEEENYFFRLSRYASEIERVISSGELAVFPETRKNEILSFIREGVTDVSFSRPAKDIPWGVPVPGNASHTMYVWCDALPNYITALGFGTPDSQKFEQFWPADLHIIGKDILRFHALIWPGMLIAAKLPLPKALLVHGHILSGGKKMSKTLGNVVNPFDLIERYGKDAVRYYFASKISPFEDSDFTYQNFEESYEADLANGLGNLTRRLSTMIKNYFGGTIGKPEGIVLERTLLKRDIGGLGFLQGAGEQKVEYVSLPYFAEHIVFPEYQTRMEKFEIHRGADIAFGLIREIDGYIQDYEPFKLIKTDQEQTRAVLWNAAAALAAVAHMLTPFLPEAAAKIEEIFGVENQKPFSWAAFTGKDHEPLFPRLQEKTGGGVREAQ